MPDSIRGQPGRQHGAGVGIEHLESVGYSLSAGFLRKRVFLAWFTAASGLPAIVQEYNVSLNLW